MDVFNLLAKLTLDSTEYENGLGNAEESANSVGSKLSNGLGKAAKISGAAIAAVGTGVAVVSKKMADGINSAASYGDNIDKMSQKLGISAEAYQEWDFVAQHAGTSIDGLQASMKTLSNAAVDGNDAFEKLGISLEDAQRMSTEDLFSAVISGLQEMDEGTERTALASDLLGKSATELGALFNMSAEETAEMRQQVHDLGGVMSDESVKASADFADSLQNLQTSLSGISRGAMSEFLPAVTQVMDGFTGVFGGDDSSVELINSGLEMFIDKLTDALPKISTIGTSIISTLAVAVIENLPGLAKAAADVVLKLSDLVIENLPFLVETAGTIIISLASGISDYLPTLIPTVVDVMLTIVDNLINNIDMLVDGAIKLITGLTEGLIGALPILIAKMPEIIIKMVEALIRNIPKLIECARELMTALVDGIESVFDWLSNVGEEIIDTIKTAIMSKVDEAKEWGQDLIDNFIGGIKKKWENLKSTVSNVADTVKDFLGFSEPKKGPLSNFHTYAPDMMELFASGIKDNERLVTDQIAETFNFGELGNYSTVAAATTSSNDYQVLTGELVNALSNMRVVATIDGDDVFSSVKSKAKAYKSQTGKYAFS